MPSISTRSANSTDAETVARFIHALLDELTGGKAPTPDVVRQSAETVLADAGVVAVIASGDDEPVGIMVLNELCRRQVRPHFGAVCSTRHALHRDCPSSA